MEAEDRGALLASASSGVGGTAAEGDGSSPPHPPESQPQRQGDSSAAAPRRNRYDRMLCCKDGLATDIDPSDPVICLPHQLVR